MASVSEPLVVWINGAFGVGKTSVAEELVTLLPDAILFDPELLGTLLRIVIPAREQTDDFQDIPAWRHLSRDAVVSLSRTRRGAVVVPMTLVDGTYFAEIVGGIRAQGVRLVHVALVAPVEVITGRLCSRSDAEQWAVERIERCVAELADACFAEQIDAASATPRELAVQIERLVEGAG